MKCIYHSNTAYVADSIQFSINNPSNTATTVKILSKGVTFGAGEIFVNGSAINTLSNASWLQTVHTYTTPSSTQNTYKWVYTTGSSEGYFVLDMIEVIW